MSSRQIAGQDVLPLSEFTAYIANRFYLPFGASEGQIAAGTAPGSGSIRLHPFYVKQTITISALGLRLTTASAGGNVQAAIYANNAATMRPTGNALVSTASMSTTSTGVISSAASVQLQPGLYWIATNMDNGTSAAVAFGPTGLAMGAVVGTATEANIIAPGPGLLIGLSVAQTFGTWPDLTSGSFTELTAVSSVPMVYFKVASVP